MSKGPYALALNIQSAISISETHFFPWALMSHPGTHRASFALGAFMSTTLGAHEMPQWCSWCLMSKCIGARECSWVLLGWTNHIWYHIMTYYSAYMRAFSIFGSVSNGMYFCVTTQYVYRNLLISPRGSDVSARGVCCRCGRGVRSERAIGAAFTCDNERVGLNMWAKGRCIG